MRIGLIQPLRPYRSTFKPRVSPLKLIRVSSLEKSGLVPLNRCEVDRTLWPVFTLF